MDSGLVDLEIVPYNLVDPLLLPLGNPLNFLPSVSFFLLPNLLSYNTPIP